MFFNDFQHLSPNANDNRYNLTEKFKKELRRGDKERLEKLLAKKEKRLDAIEKKKEKLVSVSHAKRIDPEDTSVGIAGTLLPDVVKREEGHLRDIAKIKAAKRRAEMAEELFPMSYLLKYLIEEENEEQTNMLDPDVVEKQNKKQKPTNLKIEKQTQEVDQKADQDHL